MVVLGLVWLGLLIVEYTRGLTPLLEAIGNVIWGVFVLEFAVRFAIAPRKVEYVKRNLLTLASLALPALRGLRLAGAARLVRGARAARGARLFRLVTSLNRGMKALRSVMSRRGLSYVLALTVLVTAAGAAGMYTFERNPGGAGLNDYSSALWWTAMLMTTMGSEFWPRTPEGRLLCLALAIYAFAVFGYITAALASFFVSRDAATATGEVAGARDLRKLREEIASLRAELRAAGRS